MYVHREGGMYLLYLAYAFVSRLTFLVKVSRVWGRDGGLCLARSV